MLKLPGTERHSMNIINGLKDFRMTLFKMVMLNLTFNLEETKEKTQNVANRGEVK